LLDQVRAGDLTIIVNVIVKPLTKSC